MPLVERYKYRDAHNRFHAACEWMRSKGIAVDRTRAGEYERILIEIAAYYERGAIDDLITLRGSRVLFNAMAQASEFVDIHSGVSRLPSPHVEEKLRDFVGGAVMLEDETLKLNHPRNVGFELLIAAASATCGLTIDLAPPADLSWIVNSTRLFVECKRPFAKRKIANRIREGLRQLTRRYEASPDPAQSRGVLAVSVSRVFNDGSRILQVPNEAAVDAEMERIFDQFIKRYRHYWLTTDSRTLAVLLELRTACRITELNLFTILRQHVFVLLCKPKTDDYSVIQSAAGRFGALGKPKAQ
jgi:hypothetical protein